MSTRRPKSVLDQERYTAELSTGQLVIGVCILLMFGLGCFLLGVLIGKFDPTLDNKIAQSDSAGLPNERTTEVTVIEPVAQRPSAPAVDSSVQTLPPPELRAPQRVLNTDASPPPASQTPLESKPPAEAATTAASPPLAETLQAEAARNRVSPPSEPPQAVSSPAESAAPPVSVEAPPKDTKASAADTATAEAPKAAAEDWTGYGVQVVALARDKAETALSKLQAGSSYKGRVLPPARGQLYRVVTGPYTSESAAAKARDELRARGYKDAFILRLR